MKRFGHIHRNVLLTAGIVLVLVNRLLISARLRRRADGWRRGAGLVLRGESATFVLSAFALDTWSDAEKPPAAPMPDASAEHLAQRLESFLAGEPATHTCIRCSEIVHDAERFDRPTYTFGVEPWVDGPGRFVRPENWAGIDHLSRTPDAAPAGDSRVEFAATELLNFIARFSPEGHADLWVRVNHVGLDGVPMQEVLSRLQTAWRTRGEVIFPTPESFAGHRGPRPCAGRDGCIEVQDFVDFGPLLEWRKRENARLPEPMTLSAAIMWALACHPAFTDIFVGTTVDVPVVEGLGRGVGLVVIRPADFLRRGNGLADYVRAFNRELELVRRRQNRGWKTLDAAALIPPRLETVLLRHALVQGGRAFGSMGLSMIRDAGVFGAPMADAGHADGFIAIGNVALDCGAGRKVGCIAIKGPEKIAAYPAIIREALRNL